MRKKGQNLIEFIVVIPLLTVIIFGIVELSLFWRNVQTVQGIALEAAISASKVYIPDNDSTSNTAVEKAVSVVESRLGSLALKDIKLNDSPLDSGDYGVRPYALYEYQSDKTKDIGGEIKPIITFTIDYRDPYKKGIITQLIFQYSTMLLGAEFSLPGGRNVTIIPKDIEISSTKIQQYNNY